MRRIMMLAFGLALVATACGDDGVIATTATTTSEAAPSVTSSSRPGATTPSTTTVAITPVSVPDSTGSTTTNIARVPLPNDAVAAPDFEFVLADGSTFALRDASKPIYMVFWAEW